MPQKDLNRLRSALLGVVRKDAGFIEFAGAAADLLSAVVPFDRSCWHTVDPGTVLFTGSVNQNIGCSGRWLAEHEYVITDVNQWSTLARTGQLVGTTSAATSGDLNRCVRHRSTKALGIGDELRVALVANGIYWGAAGLLRDEDRPWFTEEDERTIRAVVEILASGCRRALVTSAPSPADTAAADGPAVIILGEGGSPESVTPAASRLVHDLVEEPPATNVAESKIVQSIAAQARARGIDGDPIEAPSRARVRTRSGGWVIVYGAALSDGPGGRTAVIIQPAVPAEIAPLISIAYGLTNREQDVARLCLHGSSTREMAVALGISAYTVQDHLKSIFDKTGTCTRNELVGRIFLSHYATRWEEQAQVPAGWTANLATESVAARVASTD